MTVFKTDGSTYRRAGARMLVVADPLDQDSEREGGESLGSISGGCLEDEVRVRALEVMKTGHATAVCYDTTAEADVIFGSGLGCQGIVHALIQPLLPTTPNPLAHVARALCERRAGVLATVCAKNHSASVDVGEFLWFDASADSAGMLTNPALVTAVAADASRVSKTGRPILHTYSEQGGGWVQVFIEAMRPPRSLLICGAGQDAIPLARLGKELGWRVRVVDGRRAYATRGRFPEVDELVVCPPREFSARSTIEAGEAIVLMTHNYQHDQEFLRAALASPATYVGILGPRRRTERLLSEAGEFHGSPSDRRRAGRIHGPAGLDIGAEAPEQIALAIVAEIEAVAAHRRGGRLKFRRAPLHDAPKGRHEPVPKHGKLCRSL